MIPHFARPRHAISLQPFQSVTCISMGKGSCKRTLIVALDRTLFWTNSLAINWDGKWLSLAASDEAMFHATLALVAQHKAVIHGAPLSKEYYWHRGQTIHFLRKRLVNLVDAASDATIGAVALLSSLDVSCIHRPKILSE